MQQKQYNKLTSFYAILGIVMVLLVIISQVTSVFQVERQIYNISPQSDTIEINYDSLNYNIEDISY